jgi:hypothetical protein
MLRTCLSVCLFAVLAVLSSTPANAQTLDQRTYFTFSQPVALPGVTLPAGKYMFRIVDTMGSRRVVQVLDADGKKPYAMLMSMPTFSATVASVPEVRFKERPDGLPAAVEAWYYPGESMGREFIYPKKPEHLVASAGVNAADATLPATPIASALGVASLMAGFAESIGPKMRP